MRTPTRQRVRSSLARSLVLTALVSGLALAMQAPNPPRNQSSADLKKVYEAGEAALQRNDLDTAEREFRQVLALDPNSAGAHANIGVIEMRRKHWKAALQA